MAQLTLYHATPSRSSVVLWMLEELGQPYEIKSLDLAKGDQQKPEYLAINLMGKVPTLRHGDAIVTELAAICTYLADAFPQAGLNIPIGDPGRGPYLKWLFFAPGVLEPAVTDRAFPRKEEPRRGALGYGEFNTVMGVLSKAVTPGPYLMGERFTAADVVIGANLRWGMLFKLVPERKELVDYVARITDRSAAKRALAKDEELKKQSGG
jgi:glutathione S-transferase